jgi:type II secretory pathway pseudopilin PulG
MSNPPDLFADMPEASPVSPRQVAAPPEVRRKPNLLAIILSIASVVVLIGAFAGVLIVRTQEASANAAKAQHILNQAAAAHLQDTTFDLTVTANSSGIPGAGSNLTFTGNGALTTTPSRLHLVVQIPSSSDLGTTSTSTTEEIIDGADIYIKNLPDSPSSDGKPWTEIVGPKSIISSIPMLGFSDLLDYQKLHNPQMLGETTMDGRKVWHVRADLLKTLSSLLNGGAAATATPVSKGFDLTLTLTEDLWIFEDSQLPAKVSIQLGTTVPASASSSSIGVGVNETLVFKTWNTGLAIALPPASEVQVQDLPPIPSSVPTPPAYPTPTSGN